MTPRLFLVVWTCDTHVVLRCASLYTCCDLIIYGVFILVLSKFCDLPKPEFLFQDNNFLSSPISITCRIMMSWPMAGYIYALSASKSVINDGPLCRLEDTTNLILDLRRLLPVSFFWCLERLLLLTMQTPRSLAHLARYCILTNRLTVC
jgi:hypothetical protein